ncbi:MAG: YceI family protein [Campylobacterota bacterium]
MKMLAVFSISSILALSSLVGADFKVDRSHSDLGFKVRHMMVSNTIGRFDDFSGTFSYDPRTKQLSALRGEAKVDSINTEDAKRDDHLRGPDFFDAKKHPTVTMQFVKQKGDRVTVALTIKGVTKNIILEMDDASKAVKDPWGNTRVGFALEGKINRQDFNIKFSKVMETGGVMVGDKVKLSLEIEGVQLKEPY